MTLFANKQVGDWDRWYFNIMDIPICVIRFKIRSNPKIRRPECIAFTKISITSNLTGILNYKKTKKVCHRIMI